MKRERTNRFFLALVISCFLSIIPFSGYAADLTISDIITTNGNWTLNGSMTAATFTGSGSGLSNVTASGLSCIGCVSQSHLNFTPGTITGISGGTGLTGGGSSGYVTLNVNFSGTGSASAAARSDHNHDAVYQKKYGKVAVVAQSGGDYSDPVAAMANLAAWCDTPSDTNPCLLKIMPGVYDIGNNSLNYNLPYIDIEGSGESVTTITGHIDTPTPVYNPQGVITGFSEIRFLSVENTGGGTNSVAISLEYGKLKHVTAIASGGTNSNYGVFCSSNDLAISDVTAIATGGHNNYGVYTLYIGGIMTNVTAKASAGTSHNFGIYNNNYSTPAMVNVTAKASASGGSFNYGVYNSISAPTMTNVTATASGGNQNYGVYNQAGVNNQLPVIYPVMMNVTATASGGSYNYGVYNISSSPIMTSMTATAFDGTAENHGVYNTNSSIAKINHSIIKGTSDSICNFQSTVYVANTELNDPTSGSGFICVGAYSGSYLPLNSSCQ